VREGIFIFVVVVTNVFPLCFPIDSNQVLKMFPNLFLVAQHFYSIHFVQS
jgi:ABC-type transport system involved in cytochrome c biogenesis permease component